MAGRRLPLDEPEYVVDITYVGSGNNRYYRGYEYRKESDARAAAKRYAKGRFATDVKLKTPNGTEEIKKDGKMVK